MRHFLDLRDISADDISTILATAQKLKATRGRTGDTPFPNKALGMIFEKPSTRTRVSFEVGARELGGYAIVLQKEDLQLGRGETVADTARVLSRYLHALMLRSHQHATLLELAEYADIPVINGLTNLLHPCQIMADLQTIQEKMGNVHDLKIAWVGDGNNMANTWVTAAAKLGFQLTLACPERFSPDKEIMSEAVNAGARVSLSHDPVTAVKGAHVVNADTWVSMGDDDTLARHKAFEGYQVNDALMAHAHKEAIFLHCLPAHRGEEVSDSVFDGAQSMVWDEAENRLHIQKAIIMWCIGEI